jgi:hypothetical protein
MLGFFHYHFKIIPHYIYFFFSFFFLWVIQISITLHDPLRLIIVNYVTSKILNLFKLAYKFI